MAKRSGQIGAEELVRRVARVAPYRMVRTREAGLAGLLASEMASCERARRRTGGAWGALEGVLLELGGERGAELAAACEVEGVRRGVLRVAVRSSSARFEIDRLMRSGGEGKVISRAPVTIRSVRLVAGSRS